MQGAPSFRKAAHNGRTVKLIARGRGTREGRCLSLSGARGRSPFNVGLGMISRGLSALIRLYAGVNILLV